MSDHPARLWQIVPMDTTPEAFGRFTRVAGESCNLVEEPPSTGACRVRVGTADGPLSELLAAAFHLPDVDPSDNDTPATVSQSQRKDVYASLQVRVGVLDAGEDATMIAADGLADVWRDLRNGLDALNADHSGRTFAGSGASGCRHLGAGHAVDALAALHDA
jgi:hypothetical protein